MPEYYTLVHYFGSSFLVPRESLQLARRYAECAEFVIPGIIAEAVQYSRGKFYLVTGKKTAASENLEQRLRRMREFNGTPKPAPAVS